MICRTVRLKDCFDRIGADGEDPQLDLFLPYNMEEMGRQNQKRPCIIILPGGAYAFCSQREGEAVALHFLPEGYNVFVLRYSTAPYRYPVQVNEVRAVFELIGQKADEWNCDVTKTILMGFSAGGHLAAFYSTMNGVDPKENRLSGCLAPKLCVLCYPVISADPSFTHKGSIDNLSGKTEQSREEIAFFSCEKRVSGSTPPTFIWHTASDGSVPVKNSLVYAGALSENGVPFELHVYPSGAHGLSTCDEQTNDKLTKEIIHDKAWLDGLKRWLELNLND